MATIPGSKITYLFRVFEERETKSGAVLAYTTENGRTLERSADSTPTKDGSVRTPGEKTEEITLTCILSTDSIMIDKIQDAVANSKLMEVWEANLDKPVTESPDNTKFEGKYWRGYATNFELSSPADGQAEVSITVGLEGNGVSGEVTVSKTQQEIVAYMFADTTIFVPFKASFDKGLGTGSMSDITGDMDNYITLPTSTFTPPSSKVFDGWSTTSGGAATLYPGDKVSLVEDTTYYAIYKNAE